MLLSKINEIELWKDPGYMLGGVEIPGVGYADGADLGTPDEDMVLDRPLLPDRFTNHYEIKVDGMVGDDVTCYRYMRLHVPQEGDDVPDFLLYCWITDVIRNADTAPACIIRYEIDYWRTYLANLTFGRGTVTRCSDPTYRRPRSLQPRKRYIDSVIPLNELIVPEGNRLKSCVWGMVIFTANTYNEGGDLTASHLRMLVFPIDPTGDQMYFFTESGGNVRRHLTPTYSQVFNGYIDEIFGLDPDSIVAFYISPINPSDSFNWQDGDIEAAGTTYHGYWKLSASPKAGASPYTDYGCFEQNADARREYVIVLEDPVETDDITTYSVTDIQGNVIYNAPYGIAFDTVRLNLDVSSQGGYLAIFLDDSDDPRSYKECAALGMACALPLVQVPVTSNAWASYNYSGQREYDKEQAQIARDQQAVNGLTGALGGAVSGALTGALVGAAGGPVGAIAGAAIGAGTQLAGVGITYATARYFNDRLQDSKDALYSRQANTVILTGSSSMYIRDNLADPTARFGYLLLGLRADSVSEQEIEDDISLNGYETQIPVPDVTSFVNAGGPLRIENMTIGGEDVPYRAIAAIKDMFLRGVYIINPPEEEEP